MEATGLGATGERKTVSASCLVLEFDIRNGDYFLVMDALLLLEGP